MDPSTTEMIRPAVHPFPCCLAVGGVDPGAVVVDMVTTSLPLVSTMSAGVAAWK
jgi:hypothetical protein